MHDYNRYWCHVCLYYARYEPTQHPAYYYRLRKWSCCWYNWSTQDFALRRRLVRASNFFSAYPSRLVSDTACSIRTLTRLVATTLIKKARPLPAAHLIIATVAYIIEIALFH